MVPESYVPLNYLEFLNITFLRVLSTDGRVRKPYFHMQIILIGTESLLEMSCVTDMAFCCLFPSVVPYYQWLALHFFVWQIIYFKDIANFITNKKTSQYG